MHSGKLTEFTMPSVNAFRFQIKYTETDRSSHTHEIGLHTHSEFELYINLSGDVSFLVENNLYDLSRGDVIIARPGEYHHCVYRSDAPHKLFWILFDCDKNRGVLDFLRNDFSQNFVSLKNELREELIDLCYALHSTQLSEEEKLYAFFRVFAILKQSINAAPVQPSQMPQELRKIIDYIDGHISEEITVKGIAKELYISQSTLERQFKEALDITPLEYIRKKNWCWLRRCSRMENLY